MIFFLTYFFELISQPSGKPGQVPLSLRKRKKLFSYFYESEIESEFKAIRKKLIQDFVEIRNSIINSPFSIINYSALYSWLG